MRNSRTPGPGPGRPCSCPADARLAVCRLCCHVRVCRAWSSCAWAGWPPSTRQCSTRPSTTRVSEPSGRTSRKSGVLSTGLLPFLSAPLLPCFPWALTASVACRDGSCVRGGPGGARGGGARGGRDVPGRDAPAVPQAHLRRVHRGRGLPDHAPGQPAPRCRGPNKPVAPPRLSRVACALACLHFQWPPLSLLRCAHGCGAVCACRRSWAPCCAHAPSSWWATITSCRPSSRSAAVPAQHLVKLLLVADLTFSRAVSDSVLTWFGGPSWRLLSVGPCVLLLCRALLRARAAWT